MKYKEWVGDEKLVYELLDKAGLDDNNDGGEKKMLMREIIICRYLKYMRVDEICARIMFTYRIELDKSKYYRIFNCAIKLIEKHIKFGT